MKRILCYGDSNTWGFAPELYDNLHNAPCRYAPDIRWTGRLAKALGQEYTVIEEGFNGRTTVFDDPTAPGRNGQVAFRTHEPLDLILIMLGTNDTKDLFSAPPVSVASGMERLVKELSVSLRSSVSWKAKILIAAPIVVQPTLTGEYLYGFSEVSTGKSAMLPALYSAIADRYGVAFVDISAVAKPGALDGVHLDPQGHASVASAMEQRIRALLA